MHIFEILNDSAFQMCLLLFCGITLSKVTNDFVDLDEIFECGFEGFEKIKMLITCDTMMPQKSYRHVWKADTLRISKMSTMLLELHPVKSYLA